MAFNGYMFQLVDSVKNEDDNDDHNGYIIMMITQ